MDKIILIICLLIVIPSIILMNKFRMKYRNTKALLIIQFCWFLVCLTIFFFFLKPNFNKTQNIVMGAFAGGGLVYFFFNFKRISENSHH